jgi:hypothetical protein
MLTHMGQDRTLDGLIEAALEISTKRREILALLRVALEQGNKEEALRLAGKLCGIEHEETDNRAATGIHRSASR